MVPLSTLTKRLSDGLGLPKNTVDLVARRMREASALPTGERGPSEEGKAHMAPEDAVKLLLALLSDCPATEAADVADDLASLPVCEFLAIHPDGTGEIIAPGSESYNGLTQHGDTLGAILTAHLEALVQDVTCPGEVQSMIVQSRFPLVHLAASSGGVTFILMFQRPRQISDETLAAMASRQTICGGTIFPYLARVYREGLRADFRAAQEWSAGNAV